MNNPMTPDEDRLEGARAMQEAAAQAASKWWEYDDTLELHDLIRAIDPATVLAGVVSASPWPGESTIGELVGDGIGVWRDCTGCHELNEGVSTGPWHPVLKCHVGVGCHECGGIGAIWDATDYASMDDYLSRERSPLTTPAPDAVARLVEAARAMCGDLDRDGIVGEHHHREVIAAIAAMEASHDRT